METLPEYKIGARTKVSVIDPMARRDRVLTFQGIPVMFDESALKAVGHGDVVSKDPARESVGENASSGGSIFYSLVGCTQGVDGEPMSQAILALERRYIYRLLSDSVCLGEGIDALSKLLDSLRKRINQRDGFADVLSGLETRIARSWLPGAGTRQTESLPNPAPAVLPNAPFEKAYLKQLEAAVSGGGIGDSSFPNLIKESGVSLDVYPNPNNDLMVGLAVSPVVDSESRRRLISALKRLS